MKRYIEITKSVREDLRNIFNCTDMMILNALTFKRNTELARKIRKVALDKNGILMTKLPSVETFHDNDNYMRQYIPNGAVLEFNKNTGEGVVYFDGKAVRHYDDVSITDIELIQEYASTLK
jgi:hypothetical protein